MFKGLRTKLESDQTRRDNSKSAQSFTKDGNKSRVLESKDTLADLPSSNFRSDQTSNSGEASSDSKSDKNLPNNSRNNHDNAGGGELTQPQESIEDLKSQLAKLNNQLSSITKERDESNDQNSQLYKIIEKLRRNLETEKETNSSLQSKLNEIESEFKDNSLPKSGNHSTSISIKSFNPDGLSNLDPKSSDVEVLRNEIIELQAQLSKKNRQLKIRQQNLNDIKKALQKEMYDHSKTQEELIKVQNHLRDREKQSHSVERKESVKMNGSEQNELIDNSTKNQDFNQNISDKTLDSHVHVGGEDSISLRTAVGVAQLDRISSLSRSSASVDDFDSNDIHQNNYNREVSHEYLKNVLFRYMTSTDTETTRHLIKAISVLMDFTPEQSAAIKSAMQTRSSWLRLK